MENVKDEQFVKRFKQIHDDDGDMRFCFILGAGASKGSGIRTGGELSKQWLEEINSNGIFSSADIAAWKKEKEINELQPELHYGEIYKKRFSDYKKSGYQALVKEMSGKEPSFGYSVLAQIMNKERHNVVITTNFDNLIETALYTFTNKKPVVCGHESLAGYATPSIETPLIIKLHRDLLYKPFNENDETGKLAEQWLTSLNNIFTNHIPIIIGYGGNDGSLMDYLKQLNPLPRLYWCLFRSENPNAQIMDVVSRHNGAFVKMNGFDNLMYKLQSELKYEYDFKSLEDVARNRAQRYLDQIREIKKSEPSVIIPKLTSRESIFKRFWWEYDSAANNEKATEKKVKIYLSGIVNTNSVDLMGNYALFLEEKLNRYDEAEKYYTQALSIDINHVNNNINYAVFLKDIRRDYALSEKCYKLALQTEVDNANANNNYGVLLEAINNRRDALKYYRKALKADPSHKEAKENYQRLRSN